jgi:hypothetical protein
VQPILHGASDDTCDYQPYCTVCSADVGIFTSHSSDWRHYRGEITATSRPGHYDAGHDAVVGWRLARPHIEAVR